MNMNNHCLTVFVLILLCGLRIQAHAFTVDNMFILADDKGNGVVTLHNNDDYPIFITSEVQELQVHGRDIDRVIYTRDNLKDWKVSLTHGKVILKPGESKDVGIRNLCHNVSCESDKDLMFSLPFSPSPYVTGEDTSSRVQINYGYAPVFIIPTSRPQYDYQLRYKGDQVTVNNNSNTVIYVTLDGCETGQKRCKQTYTVIAGREKTFQLLQGMQREVLLATITAHDRRYRVEQRLQRESE